MSLRWKLWGIVFSLVAGFYLLVPTIFNLPERRQTFVEQEKSAPWYFDLFPSKGLNLGLDLRGGVYIEMEVLVEEGIKAKLDNLAQDLQRDLEKQGTPMQKWSLGENFDRIEFEFAPKTDITSAFQTIARNTSGLLIKEGSAENGRLAFRVAEGEITQWKLDILNQAVQSVRNRIDAYGLTEPTVQKQGDHRLIVELPGVKDVERALEIIKKGGKLEFKIVNEALSPTALGDIIAKTREENNLPIRYSFDDLKRLNELMAPSLPEGTEATFELGRDETGKVIRAQPFLLDKTVYVTGDMLDDAQLQREGRTNKPYVALTFNKTGAKNFGDVTTKHVKGRLAILLDGFVMSDPVIQEPIRNGRASITLTITQSLEQTLAEAKDLTFVLQEGALPARLQEVTKTVIGPSLGADSIQKSLRSMIWGTVAVVAFMLVYYRLSGVLANLALIANGLFIFAILAMFQATLTLPGMAGIVLTIGMAVDANVLIFERIREELRLGQTLQNALNAGYGNAVRAIMDSNLTTIIAGIILYQFGTGPIKGFAVTLMIGLICNLFTAVVMTRAVFEYFIFERRIERLSL